MTQRPPAWSVGRVPDGGRAVSLEGCWSLNVLLPASGRLHTAPLMADLARLAADPALGWDLRGIERLDDAGAALLWQAWGRRLPGKVELQPVQVDVFGR